LIHCSLRRNWFRGKISPGYEDANNEEDKADHGDPDLNTALPAEVGELCQLKQDENASHKDTKTQRDTLHKYS